MINNIKIKSELAITLSLSLVLNFVTVLKMPLGGSVTLGHTVPIIIFSLKNGLRYGTYAGLIYGIIKILISLSIVPAKSFLSFILATLLDYIIPYSCISLSCSVGKFFSSKKITLIFSCVASNILKLVSSVLSGIIVWADYVPYKINILLYSLIYNSFYILPETILCVVICMQIYNFFSLKNITPVKHV